MELQNVLIPFVLQIHKRDYDWIDGSPAHEYFTAVSCCDGTSPQLLFFSVRKHQKYDATERIVAKKHAHKYQPAT